MVAEVFQLQNPWRRDKGYVFDFKQRDIFKILLSNLDNELIIGLIGSRQVGKSSLMYLLIEHLLKSNVDVNDIFYFNLDNIQLHSLFDSTPEFIQFVGKDNNSKKYVFIDEIQRLNSPGLFLKEIFDLNRDIKIIFSGSSQLEIKAKIKEHLVGRTRTFTINRLSFKEYLDFAAPITRSEALENILLYGSYPAIAKESSALEKKLRLQDIFNSYFQKDLVDFIRIKNVDRFNKFLIKIAAQNGNLLNVNSVSNALGLHRSIVEEYLNILEHTFICKRVYPFHKNYNKEIVKTPKLYFLDLGLRNLILNDFRSLELRDDTGNLFETFYLTELLSADHYNFKKINFWRTTNKTEIDFIVKDDGLFEAVEVKWKSSRIPKVFNTIKILYPGIKTRLITRDTYMS